MIGCGAVGQGLLPLLFDTFAISPPQLTIITADESGRHIAERFGVRYLVESIAPVNCQPALAQHLHAGDLLINLSVGVSSLALIAWCRAYDVFYIDTCVEPWAGGYVPGEFASVESTNAWLRQQALALHTAGAATAVIAHGMNPGLITHLLKEALRSLARSQGVATAHTPHWGKLAQALGVKVVHIVECDTQDDGEPLPPGEFVNSWSAEGLYSEAWLQHAEMGWGSHEDAIPAGAQLLQLGQAQTLRLAEHGADIWLRSWLPSLGEQRGMLITHHEVISIASMLDAGTYHPTVCYVYNPCPKANKSLANLRAGHTVTDFRSLQTDVAQGSDEIGVLLVHETGALWHGSTLSAEEARRLAPCNSATTLQVAAGIIGALAWMLDHPREGVIEAEAMDEAQVLDVARAYLGKVATVETNWRPGPRLTFGDFLADKDHTEIR